MLLGSMMRIRVAVLVSCMVITSIAAHARQPETAALIGVAIDETGATVADVRITVTHDGTALRRQAVTGPDGRFTLLMLPAGRYSLLAEREGFSAHDMPGLVLDAGGEITVRVELKVEAFSEGVVVTAQKRGEERLQDVPIPVSVINTEALAANSEVLLRDYFDKIPSFNVTSTLGYRQTLTLRGISVQGANPTVGILVDDVPVATSFGRGGSSYMPEIDPGDLARIEVLRGPQGALYGASNMGGLLKFVTKDPTPDRLSGRVEVGIGGVHDGDDAGYNFRGSVNAPISNNAAVRISGFTRQDPGYIDNPITGEDGLNVADASGGKVSMKWQPSSGFSLKLGAIYQHIDQAGIPDVNVPTSGFPQTDGLGDLEQNYLPGSTAFDRKVQIYSANIEASLRSAKLLSVTGFGINRTKTSYDRSVAFGRFAVRDFGVDGIVDKQDNDLRKFSQEIRLSMPVGRRAELMAGGFFTKEDTHGFEQQFATTPDGRFVGMDLQIVFPRHFKERAAFANLTYRFTERFDLQIGGRESWLNEHDDDFIQSGPQVGAVPLITPPIESKASAFTYLVTPRFRITPDVMFYARLASGYQQGGPNNPPGPDQIQPVPKQYDPSKTQNYEFGFKGELFNRLLSVDMSVFYIDWDDLQLAARTTDNRTAFTTNFGGARSRGTELSVGVQPFASFSVSGWLSYIDAVLMESLPPTSPVYGQRGDRLPDSARFSGHLLLRQEFPVWGQAHGFIEGAVTYMGDRKGLFQPTAARQTLPSYTKADLRLGARYESWTANLYVNNLTDERGMVGGGLGYQPPFAFLYIQPRAIGLWIGRSF